MRWSKLKETAEGFLADSLKGRIRYYQTRYGRGTSEVMARAWITDKKREIANFSTIRWWWKCESLTRRNMKSVSIGWQQARSQAENQLAAKGYYADFHFTGALREYITLSIDDALQSSNSLIQAVAMFDRRLGKRRLQKMTENPPEHPLVNAFFRLRCEAEGINTT
jgi:hypothetical protein